LASAVESIRDDRAIPQPQQKLSVKPRMRPTRKDVFHLQRRLSHWKLQGGLSGIARNLYLLFVYYSGFYALVRRYHVLRRRSRGAILLYHRVNDYSKDVLTVDGPTFAAQLLVLSRRYPVSSTADLVDRLRSNKPLPPTTIAIHFDDCYRDIFTDGAPILKALQLPACAFVNSGFVDTNRSFPHDVARYPFTYENLRSSDLQAWVKLGLEIGAHTVNHSDLGTCTAETADAEIAACGVALRKIIDKPVDLFSFPFGRVDNINEPARRAISAAGCVALFSAHGGFIGPATDVSDIPRLGASGEMSPLYCLLQVEGLTLSQVASALRRRA
jgi:peptidoglycan/xylan/chitin deacetylase (PgdA/CDA1 family)